MSSRPQVPSISTNTPRDNVNSNRVSTDSPHARTPVAYSPAHSNSMGLRVGKRPLESQSRGDSPPDKRSRPPDSRSALQDRYANSAGSRIPSPPLSRKSSFAGFTNVPTGPRLASDHHRPESTPYQRRQDVRVLSPSSIGSGASTPTHHAPPVPSMLPAADLSTLRRPAVTSSSTDSTPITMQSLRRLKDRKRDIAHQMTATLSKTVDAKLTAQGMDIAYLKKERDQINREREKELNELKKELDELKKARDEERDQMMRRLKQVEAFSTRFDGLMDRPETLKLVNAATKPLAERLEVLERSAAELPDLRKGLQDLETVPNRLAAVEAQQTVVHLKPEPNQPNALENSELKSLSDRLDGLEAANSAVAKISKLENDVTTLKNAKELQKIDIEALKRWKDAQPKAISEEFMKTLITHEIQAKTTLLTKTLDKKTDDVNGRLAERITRNETSILEIQSFKERVEKQKLANQLSVLHEKVKNVERNDEKTYAKTDRLQKAVEKLRDELLPDEVDKLHDSMDKLQDKLQDKVKDTEKDLARLEKDVFDLQEDIDKYIGPIKGDYKKTNFSLSQRVANLQTTVSQSELGRLPIRLDELEKAARDLVKLSTRVDELEKGLKGPSFKRVGTPVLSSPAPNTPAMDNLDERVKLLDKSLQQLRKAVIGTNSLTSRMDTHDERIDSIEAASASARPLDTVEQTVETTADKTLDKTVEKTAEKAAEKNVKALMSSERKAAERNLEELETRVMKKIQASRNQIHGSGVSSASADAGRSQSAQSEVSGLNKHVNDIQQDLDSLFESVQAHDATISILQDVVPNLFNEHFDPLKVKVEEQLRTINNTLETHGRDISSLTQQVSNPPSQQNSFGQQQQAQLDTMVAEAAMLRIDLAALRSSLSTKADAERMSQQLEGFTFVLRNMESRYENISTDDLYQRMVRWFTQMYPSLPQIQEDISQLKALKAWIDYRSNVLNGLSQDAEYLYGLVSIASRLQELANVTPQVRGLVNITSQLQSLANSTPQLQSLVNSAPALDQLVVNASQLQSLIGSHDELPQTLAKVEQACSDAKIATTKAEQASSEAETANTRTVQIEQRLSEQVTTLENLSGSVSGLQRSLHNLNSDISTFAKADVLSAAQRTIQTLQAQLDQERRERLASAQQLRTTLDADRGSRADGEAKIRNSINENIQALRSAFDTTVNTYIEPNRDFFGLMGTALVVISQLQQVVESLNQNLPVAPLKLEWQYYLPTLGQPETNGESSNSKGKGKSKQ